MLCLLPPVAVAALQRLRESLPSGGAAGVKSSLSWMAGLVIVGDEILSGKVEDSNIAFLCTKLYEIGWTVRKVGGRCVARDDVWLARAGWRRVLGGQRGFGAEGRCARRRLQM